MIMATQNFLLGFKQAGIGPVVRVRMLKPYCVALCVLLT